jgi:enoyl-CoA hydratase/carnithine racemase
MGQFTLIEKRGRVTVITINRPEVHNALHPPASFELAQAFDDFAADRSQWVAILTGGGDKAFSTGNDLKFHSQVKDMKDMKLPPSGFGGITDRYDLNKPVIAAVNGLAYGGGFELALACDLLIASDRATFALPEVKVGLCATAGGMVRLPRIIGIKAAMGIALTGRPVSARDGLSMGFINEVVDHDKLMATAMTWAERIAENSTLAVQAAKEVMTKSLDIANLPEAMQQQAQYPALKRLFSSTDFVEGPLAFAQKRKPVWAEA